MRDSQNAAFGDLFLKSSPNGLHPGHTESNLKGFLENQTRH
jgi:hypothetical protein